MKRTLLLLILAFCLGAQTQTVKLKPGTNKYSVVTICANALCTGGLTSGQFAASVNTSTAQSWRMVYKGTTATALFQSTGYTYTVYSLHVDSSQANCIAFAKANGITIPAALLTPYGVSLP
jgi:uncharacterized membrane protein